ncbi:MAG: nucleotide exchange factor GrpE, partial [Coprobacillus sp.]|nr:nucleotide exchange factor GrpE [Coprobacillus sp.]
YRKELEKKDEEINSLKLERDHWKNEYYRAYADTQNLRKQLEKDHQEALKYRATGFIDGLLPILDSFYLVLSSSPSSPEVKNYVEGFSFIYKNIIQVLEDEGVKEIVPKVGDKFDSKTMDGIETEVDDTSGLVKKVYTRGYSLHDRVIRPASVCVSVKEESKEEAKDNQEKESN